MQRQGCIVYLHFMIPGGTAGLLDHPEIDLYAEEPNIPLGTQYWRVDKKDRRAEFQVTHKETGYVEGKLELHLRLTQPGAWGMFRKQ